MILEPTLLTLESLLVAIRTVCVLALRSWASLTRVLRINLVGRNPVPRSFVRYHLLECSERERVQTSVHPRPVIDGLSHLFEVFKDDYRSQKLRDPFDNVPRDFVQAIVNVVTFFSLHARLERGLVSFLHPLALGEKRVTLLFHRRILEHHGVFHRTASTHCSNCNTVLVHIHTNNRVCTVLAGDLMSLVCDGDVEPPLIVFVNDFSSPNPPLLISEGSSQSVEIIWTAMKFTFDVRASCGGDAESNRPVVLGEQTVAFTVIHHYRVRLVDVWVGSPPPVIFVVVIGFDFTECLVNDKLGSIVDVIGVINDSRCNIAPIPTGSVESIGFVADAAGLNTARLQVVVTPRINV
ncbi:hypothetical protein Natoc_3618 [Natronococcus occultus SP4]|uniref:Uncharacterized protein n=1 Tax=Natronococcus occultus SP4 TaxID=694430 RepID=L0K2X3_9EURY|nr:hypothetical protein Natoc_3618 [Natronococcus occultus SP4]